MKVTRRLAIESDDEDCNCRNQLFDHSPYILTKKQSFLPRSICPKRVVVVGSSDSGYSALQTILTSTTYYTNIIFISEDGVNKYTL